MSRRRQAFGGVRPLDPVRARRAGQAAAQGRVAGAGNTVDSSGRIQSNPGDALYTDRDGKLQIRYDADTLEIVPGSPLRLRGRVAPAEVRAVEAVAEENADGIEELDARTQAFLTDHEVRIATLEGGGGGGGGSDILALTGF